MHEWIPVPGTAKARLIEAAMHHFEQAGFEAATVTDLASKAGVTTGSLYHHFGSKLGLYTMVRDDLEKRITDRMEGAAETVGGPGRPAARAALLVAFDATVRFGVCRLLGETAPSGAADPVRDTLADLLPDDVRVAAVPLVAAWRAALREVADGAPAAGVRAALEFVLA
ncbi:TetR/AcrR family transcriptional regulator [Jiangella alkaliphila]|uniref:DNA-binding transcriptional regulator, AcrR family n=1 Tax=Jiangella alkaliphila TaxID=419479 RepID=A0A1H2M568_9ACTN|nr:TetR/AcrR family transcriptional regulator [Jiangella alkaliphila]SDU88407.1 DNA-binding transcriptional regulator, AcrR family [Jiangella alkaliphila]